MIKESSHLNAEFDSPSPVMHRLPKPLEGQIVVSQELIEMIIDQLAGNADSLRRCSLVSREWTPRCRYQLLKSVVFSNASPAYSLERWRNTFGATNGTHSSAYITSQW